MIILSDSPVYKVKPVYLKLSHPVFQIIIMPKHKHFDFNFLLWYSLFYGASSLVDLHFHAERGDGINISKIGAFLQLTMRNLEIADTLRMIADMLEIKGENFFKVKAYRQAVLTLETLPEDVETIAGSGRLMDIPGIGKGIAEKIEELLDTGKLMYFEELRKTLPEGLIRMLEIPNVGPKTVHALFEKLGVKSIDELKEAALKGEIKNLEHFGEKTEQNILRGIELLKSRSGRMLLGAAFKLSESIVSRLEALECVQKTSPAGSLRRRQETIGDIDILVSSDDARSVMDFFIKMPEVTEVVAKGDTKSSVILENRVQADLRVVPLDSFGAALQYFTGSKHHNVRLREMASRKGLKINEYGVFEAGDGKRIGGGTEADVYEKAGLCYIPPELREDRGEIQAALEDKLPDLIEDSDIKGDLHVHSSWSDGNDSIQDMAEKALEHGYEYIAVCDHSSSLKIAGGLSPEDKLKQLDEIESVNAKIKGIRVLAGAEVDILHNGLMDYGDDILSRLDIVIAAVHSGFKQDSETLTARVLRAMNNKYVNIIAHPTGRLIQHREAYSIDMDKIMEEAASTGTFLELNAYPDRLDLNDVNCRKARDAGVGIAIGTDCHNKMQFDVMKYGVGTARRGWLEKKDVINTLNLKEIMKLFKRKKK